MKIAARSTIASTNFHACCGAITILLFMVDPPGPKIKPFLR
jgi:hypothetical protein